MGKSAPSPPPAPDPGALIKEQGEQNRITQFTPYGDLLFGTTTPEGEFEQETGGVASLMEETATAKQLRLIAEEAGLNIAGEIAPLAQDLPMLTFEGLPERATGLDLADLIPIPGAEGFSEDAIRLEEATFQRALSYLQPEFDRAEEKLTQELANRGLPIGSEAYNDALNRFQEARDRSLTEAAYSAVQAGRTEQTRLANLAFTGRGQQLAEQLQDISLADRARMGGFGELEALRSSALGELAALLGGQQFAPIPAASFIPPGSVDVMSPYLMQQRSQLAGYQAETGLQQAEMGGWFSLGQSALMAAALRGE